MDLLRSATRVRRSALHLGACVILVSTLAACGDDDESASSVASTSAPTSTVPTSTVPTTNTVSSTSVLATTVPATTSVPETSVSTTTTVVPTTTAPDGLAQPAIWPAADVVFDTPEAAAEDFVATVLRVPPVLGEFRQGDSRSGEIEVYSRGEGDAGGAVFRSLLLLRRLGPDDGWFVLAAVNEHASIATPAAGASIAAGPVAVEGVARGFEANVNVSAFVAGDVDRLLDQQITMGGNLDSAEPFGVTLDLSDAPAGEVVVLLVHGGAGLETDPGDFGAIAVVIAG